MFNNPTIRRLWLKIRYPAGIILLLLTPPFMQPHLIVPAFIISLIGALIQAWSFASLVKNEELTIRGPYVLVRNPMYLGRYLVGLGFIILFGQLWLAVAYTVLYYLYMYNRVKREEKLLAELLPGHAEYCSKVNRFLPTPGVSDEYPLWFFSWSQLRINHGLRSFIVIMSIWAALAVYLLWLK